MSTPSGLNIAPDLALPLEAVTETFCIVAKRGSGKTYTAKVLVEEMMSAGLPVCVVDPLGVWWGLRSSADGKADGLPVVIFGGDHADVPLEETAGQLIADVVIGERISVVLDLSLLSKSAGRRFMLAFAERLQHKNRDALHLVVDEADMFAPQRTQGDGARLLGAMEDLVRRGRSRGIGSTLITQRPAVLNKDVLTQAEVLIALRMTGVLDVAAIDAWVKLHDVDDQAAAVKASLPSLPVGTAWVWSPGWLGVLQKVKIRQARTFDSSATPKAGERRIVPKRMADVDLAALGERITATVERAKADDPATLKKRITALEREIASFEPKIERVEIPVLTEDLVTRLEGVLHDLQKHGQQAVDVAQDMLDQLHRWAGKAMTPTGPAPRRETRVRVAPQTPARGKTGPTTEGKEGAGASGGAAGPLPRAQRAILTVLVQHGRRTTTQVALLTGYSHKSGGFRNSLSSLRSAGYIDGRGDVEATQAGVEALGDYAPLPSGMELIDWWRRQLGKAERTILDVLVDAYPAAVPTQVIAERAEYAVTSGGFRNALSRLRSLELASGRGELVLSDTLGEEAGLG